MACGILMPMSKVKRILGIGCTSTLAVLIGLGGVVWIRGNAAPDYKIPEWKLPTPNAYDTLLSARKLEVGTFGKAMLSPAGRYDEKEKKFVYPTQPLEDRKALLEKNQVTIAKVREALTQEFATPQTPGDLSALADNFPRFADCRELARMLFFASRTYADLGQKDKAAECALDAMALGVLISHRSYMIGELVGVACEAIGRKALWELADGLDATTARATIARLEKIEAQRPSLPEVLISERDYYQATSISTFRSANAWQIADGASDWQTDDHTEEVEETPPRKVEILKNRVVGTVKILWFSKKRIFADNYRYQTEITAQSKLPYDPKRPLPRRSLDPTMSSPLEIYGQLQVKDCTARAETRLAILYLALRVFRLEKGSYPDTLSELVTNGYCKFLPDDPFAPRFGQSFGYRRELGDKITLWSCGPDGDDDNGRAIDAKRDGGKPRRYVQSGDEGDMVARVNTY